MTELKTKCLVICSKLEIVYCTQNSFRNYNSAVWDKLQSVWTTLKRCSSYHVKGLK